MGGTGAAISDHETEAMCEGLQSKNTGRLGQCWLHRETNMDLYMKEKETSALFKSSLDLVFIISAKQIL